MRAAFLVAALIVFGACVAGCSSVPADPRLGALLDHEIAVLGSAAKIPGPRSVAQVASITADVEAAQRHRAEGWRR